MKITFEELDKAILKSIEERLVNLFVNSGRQEYGKECEKSQEFGNVITAYIKIFGSGDKTIKDLIFNCLMTGFDIGYVIAKNREVKQLEEMYQGEEDDRSG